jgi:hypothetical protein
MDPFNRITEVPMSSCISRLSNAALGALQEGQKVSYEEQRGVKRGKSSAENLKSIARSDLR